MFRSITPKKQAELIQAFMAQHPTGAAHTAVLELVASLNGAPHWNALQAQAGKERETALSKAVKTLLRPLAQARKGVSILEACHPGSKTPVGRGLIEGLYAWLAEPTGHGTENPTQLLHRRLTELQTVTDELLQASRQSLGHCREDQAPDDGELVVLSTRLFDESVGFSLEWEGDLVDLFDDEDEARNAAFEDLMAALLAKGLVREATVAYPRGDRYGVPSEATETGCRDWLWEMGFAVDTRFDSYGTDRGDDGMASIELVLSVPPALYQEMGETLSRVNR